MKRGFILAIASFRSLTPIGRLVSEKARNRHCCLSSNKEIGSRVNSSALFNLRNTEAEVSGQLSLSLTKRMICAISLNKYTSPARGGDSFQEVKV